MIAFGSEYLRIVSFNFISGGIVFTTSSVFQGIGNTLPPLFSSLTRLVLFAVPALLISRMPGFEIREVWYLSVGPDHCPDVRQSFSAPARAAEKASIRRTGKFHSRERYGFVVSNRSYAFTARHKRLCRPRSWFSLSRCEWLPVSAQRCCH